MVLATGMQVVFTGHNKTSMELVILLVTAAVVQLVGKHHKYQEAALEVTLAQYTMVRQVIFVSTINE